jgi:hypothetical protein
LGATKLARKSPNSNSWHSHWQSPTSVFRPGTFFTCAALHNNNSKSSSRIAHTGRQYTPVASIATVVTPNAASQSRSASSPRTVVLNSRTS